MYSDSEKEKWVKVASKLLRPGKEVWVLPDVQIQRSRSEFKKQLFDFCRKYQTCLTEKKYRSLVYNTIRHRCQSVWGN